ncbi:Glycosyl hydrolases family 38 N-terminal domain-containing protein [Paenibacillus sp. 1_12]|uniref:glycoside hydrolase family 38 N-terminal domain-containing protein n=1 Tax=Paenibacillus sp. 1_12 TaxID=1566278 RepID=UPI0008EB30CE|nr:glycoside hydrolase family 38 C-terminal domain-containing protein [Paenibacillus sp. 1_12]SFL08676.1 Glycosyl hydrolases family 38 N-terminal domain-containing protein [Paenibacillus sp. 1_12]
MHTNLEKIYVVFKTHFDIGFTGLVSEVVHRYRTEMLEEVIQICEETNRNENHEKYVWTMSAWPLLQSLEGSGEQDRSKALQFLDNRQLIWHMLPYTTHTEFCGLEEWIRGMYVSRGLSEKYGYRPKDAKMTDVPGHTWIVPSLLKKAGVEVLHLGCNPATTPPDVPPVFYWEGPDGERLLTFYSKGAYGTGILPPEDWEHPIWLAMIQTSDNHGPHEASYIQEMKASIEARGSKAELHIGSLTDFAEDFLARNPDLPVIRGDMADSWIHGVGTAPREVSRVRELRGRITAVESALSMNSLESQAWNVEEQQRIKQAIDTAYEYTLHFGEHTWGLDCKSFLFPRRYEKAEFIADKSSERYMLMERSWQEQIDYLNKAESSIEEAEKWLRVQPQWNQTSISAAGTGSERKQRVYNNLGWQRDAWVRIAADSEYVPNEHDQWIDCTNNELLKVIHDPQGVLVEVKGLPALGYKTIVCVQSSGSNHPGSAESSEKPLAFGSLSETQAVIENPFVVVKLDRKTGWIISLFDKRLNKEWVDAESAQGFGQYEYNIYSNREITSYIKKYAYRFYDWGVHDFGKTDYPEQQKRVSFHTELRHIRLIQGVHSVQVECVAGNSQESVMNYGNAREVIWTVTLTEDSPFVDMEWQISGKEETPLAESGHIVFPLQLTNPSYRINKMGSVMDPLADIVPSSSTLLNCCENFVDVSDGKVGMAIVPLDSPLFFIGRNGMWDFEHNYVPEKPEMNFNIFNNWWGTNFPQWTGGSFIYRYRLIPHAGDWVEGSVWKTAQETMTSALTVPAPAAATAERSDLNNSNDQLELLPLGLEGMAVTCFKPAEDGDGYILRIRDWIGKPRLVTIELLNQVSQVCLTDLLEYDLEVLTLLENPNTNKQELCLPMQAFEVHTLRLRFHE